LKNIKFKIIKNIVGDDDDDYILVGVLILFQLLFRLFIVVKENVTKSEER